ncbi:MAG: InlB B-repeat-containing protein [bacterium]|nr:InlB B-repeat-containing protein [bacterium]
MRGLYDKVHISVGTLNLVIVVLVAALVFCLGFAVKNRGYQIDFDTQGGTVVESQTRMYGEVLEETLPPSREGYVFEGWSREREGGRLWNLQKDAVTESMTLYAQWKRK